MTCACGHTEDAHKVWVDGRQEWVDAWCSSCDCDRFVP